MHTGETGIFREKKRGGGGFHLPDLHVVTKKKRWDMSYSLEIDNYVINR